MRTSSCIATLALRMRVSMSAMGSVIVMCSLPSPAGLLETGNLSCVSHVTQADPAQVELAVHRVRATALLAAGVGPNLELRRLIRLVDERLFGHVLLLPFTLEREAES